MQTQQLGERIQWLRDSVGIDQRSAAAAAGISPSMWQRIESGAKAPKMWHLLAIASALGCSLTAITDESPLRQRVKVATRSNQSAVPEDAEAQTRNVRLRLTQLLELDDMLRAEGIGRHS